MRRCAPIFLLALLFASQLLAQSPPASELSQFIDANARFGRELLWHAHSSSPGKNIALAPLPVSLTFAALSNTSFDYATNTEIDNVFGWSGETRNTSRILVALFEKPKPPPPPKSALEKSLANPPEAWDGIWFTTQFKCACLNLLSEYFMAAARKDFGFAFENTPGRSETTARGKTLSQPYSFRITSRIHHKSMWSDDIFQSPGHTDTFTLESGQQERVGLMTSTIAPFAYANTKDFEEVALPGETAYMLVVLPARGKTVAEIEEEIAKAPVSPESQLQKQLGSVDLPVFKFADKRDLTPVLEEMGVRRAFGTLRAFSAMTTGGIGAKLTAVSQSVRIHVDGEGIRADAVVGVEGVLGGILGGTAGSPPAHFHMVVNRPFLFFMRDNVTGSLLFEGAVMDPASN
jgi:serine protease inhibitor